MATIAQIMSGLETRLGTISGLRVSDTLEGEISPPWAMIGVPPVPNFHATMGRARFEVEPTISVFTSKGWDRTGQLKLAGYADPTGPTSIIAAVEADKTLGGVVEDCIVVSFRPIDIEEFGAIGYFGGVFTTRIIARGVS